MKILAIESSCDETAAAVVEDGVRILSNVVVSQVDIFAAYGGVIPEVAARSHLEAILPVIQKALDDARLTKDDIDCIAVTHTPGLLGSLLIGTLTARMLAILWQKPLYAVHHLKSHIYANWLKSGKESGCSQHLSEPAAARPVVTGEPGFARSPLVAKSSDQVSHTALSFPEFPLLALVVSGGHTQIIYMPKHDNFEIIGTTRDDAVGECFDKVAKILGLPYPGGPSIAKCASGESWGVSEDYGSAEPSPNHGPSEARDSIRGGSPNPKTPPSFPKLPVGNPQRYKLPHPQMAGLDFSFSGLKTAVLRAVQSECGLPITTPSYELKNHLSKQQKADFAASFQDTACDILIEQLKKALEAHTDVKSLVFAGGVSANQVLREKATSAFLGASAGKSAKKCTQKDQKFEQETQPNLAIYFPEIQFTGDNAAMVGAAAYFEIVAGVQPTNPYELNIAPRTAIG